MQIQETSYKVSHLYKLFLADYAKLTKKININVADYNIFLTLEENPGCTQLFLAQKRHVERSLLTRIIKKYLELDLIERRQSSTNKSAYALYLTPKGKQATKSIRKMINSLNEKIAKLCSSEEYKALNDILDLLIKRWS
ncbi:MarR family winged helix-turn-helix transcriptional regulator [Lactobacillus sp. ESL0677]|uniref:MarR family winged helix-turn-helix transcriptional regulator n=1 Tax=Lactobacillus sp. ESL0677 TaxID=2983208 RepID=UPI0023F954B0|nr:MarR family winged helix-turn-helix transcriptional regulator [Lactobacillus sp. ESL0677]WEV37292.1 MarR family winged helix-turn-helix transcriptional regulator [Lactobacillus sp. ESL0677]